MWVRGAVLFAALIVGTVGASASDVVERIDRVPLHFIENQGQHDERVGFYLEGTTPVQFVDGGMRFLLTDGAAGSQRWIVTMDFVDTIGGSRHAPAGRGKTAAHVNYFHGPKSDWKTDVPTYGALVYENVWSGIDVVLSGTQRRMKYEFVVHPGADPRQIRMRYGGATLAKTDAGRLSVSTPVGGFEDERPYTYQEGNGARREVASAYTLDVAADGGDVGFAIGDYDRTRTLVIDPEVLVYCGYNGGDGGEGTYGIAVDASGNAYITGDTSSTALTFAVTGGPDLTYNGGGFDVFVAKIAANSSLVYQGYIGGSGTDHTRGSVAVDGAGNFYISGRTGSTQATFPVTVGPSLTHGGGGFDAFVAKVAPNGASLVYAATSAVADPISRTA